METPASLDELVIETLTKDHNVKIFSCGDSEDDAKINGYLKQNAKKNNSYGYGRTYVAVRPGHSRVWAYFTLAASHVDASKFPTAKGCPHFVSVVLLGRLGRDISLRGMGIGDMLMSHVFRISLEASEMIGVHAIVLHAKTQKLASNYAGYGFVPFVDNPQHMFYPIDLIRQAMED